MDFPMKYGICVICPLNQSIDVGKYLSTMEHMGLLQQMTDNMNNVAPNWCVPQFQIHQNCPFRWNYICFIVNRNLF